MPPTPKRLALITGGNQGIGHAICKQLAQHTQQSSSSKSSSPTFHVLLAARSAERGKSAVEKLRHEHHLDNIDFLSLDVTKRESIEQAVESVRQQYEGAELSILVNNAGILATKEEGHVDEQIAQATMDVNFYGPLNVTAAFNSMFSAKAQTRVVHMSSSISWMVWDKLSDSIRQRFMSSSLTVDELKVLVDTYVTLAKGGAEKVQHGGWHPNAYGVSKIALNTLCRIQARDERREGVTYSCAHPGYVATQMTNPKAPLTPERGAETAVAAALCPPGGYTKQSGGADSEKKPASTPTGMYWARSKVYRPC